VKLRAPVTGVTVAGPPCASGRTGGDGNDGLSALWVLFAGCVPAVSVSGGLLTFLGDVGAVSKTEGATVSTSTVPVVGVAALPAASLWLTLIV
jgi:hypothetical protein